METTSLPETPRLSDTVRVSATAEIADVLRTAREVGTPLIPIGGGTSLHTGNVTTGEFLGIDTRGMTGVREYHPTDLTASFRAGTTLAEVQRILGEHGQELPVDMVHADEATIGGMVATGFAGPRRLGSGTLKDLIIGCEYVRGDGLVAKAGGMLVKNVSGFEIPRFLHGSWGALAVISSINLKVIPKPKADQTLIHLEDSLQASLDAQLRLLRQHPGVFALVTERRDAGWALAVRLLGRRSSLDAQVQALRNDLGADTGVEEGGEWWRSSGERWADAGGQVHAVISARVETLQRLAIEMASLPSLSGMVVSLGTGTLRIAFAPDEMPVDEFAARLQPHPVTWIIDSAPASWRGGASVWGPPRDDRPLVESIKAQFDPANILNRGRLFI